MFSPLNTDLMTDQSPSEPMFNPLNTDLMTDQSPWLIVVYKILLLCLAKESMFSLSDGRCLARVMFSQKVDV